MGFERANGTLGCITSMDIRGYKLVGRLSGLCDGLFEGSTDFIVQDLEVHFVTLLVSLSMMEVCAAMR